MVVIRLTQMELEQVILWGYEAEERARSKGIRVPWESDEYALLAKLRAACQRHKHDEIEIPSSALRPQAPGKKEETR